MIISTRMETDEYFIKMAKLASMRGACARRQVGCILTNTLNHVIATGYNGRARGIVNCLERPCKGAKAPSGSNLEGCEAIHAEQNALLQCKNVEEIYTAYCTASPCVHCVKLLLNTSCERIVFSEHYPGHEESRRLWESSRPISTWEHFPEQIEIYEEPVKRCDTHHWTLKERKDTTKVLRCSICGLTKEVGK
jgi:dCMP deaminase